MRGLVLGILFGLLALPSWANDTTPQCVPERSTPSGFIQVFLNVEDTKDQQVAAFVDDFTSIRVTLENEAIRKDLIVNLAVENIWIVIEKATPKEEDKGKDPSKVLAGTFRFYNAKPGVCEWVGEPFAISRKQADETDAEKQLPLPFIVVLNLS